jgi:hypothetical protein
MGLARVDSSTVEPPEEGTPPDEPQPPGQFSVIVHARAFTWVSNVRYHGFRGVSRGREPATVARWR